MVRGGRKAFDRLLEAVYPAGLAWIDGMRHGN